MGKIVAKGLLFAFYNILCRGDTVEKVSFAPNLSKVPKPQEGEITVLQEEF